MISLNKWVNNLLTKVIAQCRLLGDAAVGVQLSIGDVPASVKSLMVCRLNELEQRVSCDDFTVLTVKNPLTVLYAQREPKL